MLRTGIVAVLLALELVLHYTSYPTFSLVMQFIIVGYFIWWYFTERKSRFNYADKLLITSTIISVFSPLTQYIPNFFIANAVKFTVLSLSFVLMIIMFRNEGAKISFANKTNIFLIFASYIFLPSAFFIVMIVPLTTTIVSVTIFLYLLPMLYMVVLSTFLPYSEKGKLLISLAMFVVILSSGVNSYRQYVTPFIFDYAFVRIFTTAFRVFMLFAMIDRIDVRRNQSDYLD